MMPESKSYPIALYHNSQTQSNCPLTRSVYFAAFLRQNWLSNSRACRLIGFALIGYLGAFSGDHQNGPGIDIVSLLWLNLQPRIGANCLPSSSPAAFTLSSNAISALLPRQPLSDFTMKSTYIPRAPPPTFSPSPDFADARLSLRLGQCTVICGVRLGLGSHPGHDLSCCIRVTNIRDLLSGLCGMGRSALQRLYEI